MGCGDSKPSQAAAVSRKDEQPVTLLQKSSGKCVEKSAVDAPPSATKAAEPRSDAAKKQSEKAERMLLDVFCYYDQNNDGKLSLKELKNGIEETGLSLDYMMQADVDNDRVVSEHEWVNFFSPIPDKEIDEMREWLLSKQILTASDITWPLKDKAERLFRLADKDGNGFINLEELANVRNSEEVAGIMMDTQDANSDGKLSLEEWLAYVKKISDKNEAACKVLLRLYERQLQKNLERKFVKDVTWLLRDEAERIFKLADKDGHGFINLEELANVRNSEEVAGIMTNTQDANPDGKLSLEEWLKYVKKIFDTNDAACKAMLKVYERQINYNELKLAKEVSATRINIAPVRDDVIEVEDAPMCMRWCC